MRYSIEDLQGYGFRGFVPFRSWTKADILAETGVDVEGVYVIVRASLERPKFTDDLHWKPRPTMYSSLEAGRRWVEGTQTLYFGKAPLRPGRKHSARHRQGLAQRLHEYWRHGYDHGSNHYGGKLIWQVDDSDELLVGWKPLGEGESEHEESGLLKGFINVMSTAPYANPGSPLRSANPIYLYSAEPKADDNSFLNTPNCPQCLAPMGPVGDIEAWTVWLCGACEEIRRT